MQLTTNYGFKKPDPESDNVDVTILNENMDLLDEVLSSKDDISPSSAQNIKITSTAPQTIATYTPLSNGNFEIKIYLRVTANSNITVNVSYTDDTGLQNKNMSYQVGGLYFPCSSGTQSYAAGSYALMPLFINSVAGKQITVKVTSSTVNQVYASCAILEVR